jgi:16S rRNA (guanine966-N2)-methyltransferase
MRVTGGALRGRTLHTPAGRGTRPTADRVREALFAILGPLEAMDVLDLFSGSGALGIEALSRGAASATLVERDPRAVGVLRRNVASLGLQARARVVARDWRAALAAERAAGRRYALCLLDPPYSLVPRLTGTLGRALSPVLAPGATVVVEHGRVPGGGDPPLEVPDLPVAARTDRAYGDTRLAVLRLGADG